MALWKGRIGKSAGEVQLPNLVGGEEWMPCRLHHSGETKRVDMVAQIAIEPLLGTEEANVDDKGRVLFSNKKRMRLGERFVVTVGADGCLVAYPRAIWFPMMERIFQTDITNAGRRNFTRSLFSFADDDMKFDPQGRTVIPQKLREMCGLKDKVLLVGCGDRVEIWAKEEYAKFEADPDGYGKARRERIDAATSQMMAS